MIKKTIARGLTALICATSLSIALSAPANAANSTALGHGVKCSWVLVSSVGNVNTYKQICRKSGV